MIIIKQDYLFSKRLEIGQFFEAKPEEVGIEMSELSGIEAAKFQKLLGDTEAAVKFFVEIMPAHIVEHDLWKDQTNKYTAAEVAAIVAQRAELCLDLMRRFASEILFTQGRKS